jgi:hypothetical protein
MADIPCPSHQTWARGANSRFKISLRMTRHLKLTYPGSPWRRRILLLPIFLMLSAIWPIGQPNAQQTVQRTALPVIETVPLITAPPPSVQQRSSQYTVTLPASGVWVDAGFVVSPAEELSLRASGTLTLADGRTCGPDGLARGWKDLLRSYPDQSADVCAVVGRLGAADVATPFTVGGMLQKTAPASGEFFLAANLPDGMGVAGKETVIVTLRPADVPAGQSNAEAVPLHGIGLVLMNGLPRRVADKQGDAGDIVNFALLGKEDQVKAAFAAAGWVAVDADDKAAMVHGLLSTLEKQAYTAMPMSLLYLYGRPQDLSYARAEQFLVAVERHHIRLWNSGQMVDGRPLWVGSATHDSGLERDQRNNGVTHHVDADIDIERDFIEKTLAAAGTLTAAELVLPGNAVQSTHTATGGAVHTDGRVMLMALRSE